MTVAAALAAPVTIADEINSHGLSGENESLADGATSPLGTTSVRAFDRSLRPLASSGDEHLDLLFEMPLHAVVETQRIVPRSAAAPAAAAELAALRTQAERPRLALRPFEGLGTLQGDKQQAVPLPRPDWAGEPAGRNGPDWREAGSARSGEGEGHELLQLPRDVLRFLRDHVLQLLGTGIAVALLVAALKAYSRRP